MRSYKIYNTLHAVKCIVSEFLQLCTLPKSADIIDRTSEWSMLILYQCSCSIFTMHCPLLILTVMHLTQQRWYHRSYFQVITWTLNLSCCAIHLQEYCKESQTSYWQEHGNERGRIWMTALGTISNRRNLWQLYKHIGGKRQRINSSYLSSCMIN